MRNRLLNILALALACGPCAAFSLINSGFENVDSAGHLIGWSVHTDLDANRYGPPEYARDFGSIVPSRSSGGRAGSRWCAGFPEEGTWLERMWEHQRGRSPGGAEVDGRLFGKAALSQTVTLEPGTYVFGAWLRTADGAAYSAMFSLGCSPGREAAYQHDRSTGIEWTAHTLAVKTSFEGTGGLKERGEWMQYRTDPFTLTVRGEVTVWIRLNFANNHDMPARWQIDDAFIEPCPEASSPELSRARLPVTPVRGTPLAFPAPGQIVADCGDDDERYLVDGGESTLQGEIKARLYQMARCVSGESSFTYELPVDCGSEVVHVAFEHFGPFRLTLGDRVELLDTGALQYVLYPREYTLTDRSLWRNGRLRMRFRAGSPGQLLGVLWIEAGSTTRFRERLTHAEWDTVSVPWRVGLWDFSSTEFRGNGRTFLVGRTEPSTMNGRDMRIEWNMDPKPGHTYWLLVGYLRTEGDEARAHVNIGDDDVIEYVSKIAGYECLNYDITQSLRSGRNVVAVRADSIDFVALVEVLPGATDNRRLGLFLGGDDYADNLTRVFHNTMFWVLDLHYDNTGFIDASVPRGKWRGQYWPIDVALALRTLLYWGHLEQAENVARFAAKHGWEGHPTNRSGGHDNNAGNILVTDMCEVLRRRGFSGQATRSLWPRIRSWCDRVCDEAASSPFGLIKGTNWENSGNREQGACYALTTNQLARWMLLKASQAASEGGLEGDSLRWRDTAAALHRAVRDRLIFKEDVTTASGWVYPAGTWAYGLLDDGAFMMRPLAGYLWGAALGTGWHGMMEKAGEERDATQSTLDAAMKLVGGPPGVVSGYAASYAGEPTLFQLAALMDRTDHMSALVPWLDKQTDYRKDLGCSIAEISRWAHGFESWVEDTNLVCAAEFLDWPRYVTGVDDMLHAGAQLRLVPRLPDRWNECGVNGWLAQYRQGKGRALTRLSCHYRRPSPVFASLRVRTEDLVRGMEVRLGPFPPDGDLRAIVRGKPAQCRTEESRANQWAWVKLDCGPQWTEVQVRVEGRSAD